MNARPLTARGVKNILTRAMIDHTGLDIAENLITARRIDTDFTGPWRQVHQVIVTGPQDARREAANALYDAGLTCAPFPDRHEWSRS